MKYTNIVMIAVLLLICTFVFVEIAIAQPPAPSLPVTPDQAPLGGLGLLAAAGGAYAWKKLRQK